MLYHCLCFVWRSFYSCEKETSQIVDGVPWMGKPSIGPDICCLHQKPQNIGCCPQRLLETGRENINNRTNKLKEWVCSYEERFYSLKKDIDPNAVVNVDIVEVISNKSTFRCRTSSEPALALWQLTLCNDGSIGWLTCHRVSVLCNPQLCFILIFPKLLSSPKVWCNSVAPRLETRLCLEATPPCVTLTTWVVPLKSTLWTLTAPRRASRGSAPGTAGTWPWCPTRSAAPWAGSGPGPRGTSELLSHLHRGYACSRTQPPGAATHSDDNSLSKSLLSR